MTESNATSDLAEIVIGQMEYLHDARALMTAVERMFAANGDPEAHDAARLAGLAGTKLKDVLSTLDLVTTHALAGSLAMDAGARRAA